MFKMGKKKFYFTNFLQLFPIRDMKFGHFFFFFKNKKNFINIKGKKKKIKKKKI